MKGIDWGGLHRKYSANSYNPADIDAEISKLYANSDVDSKKGVFEFVLKPDKTIADDRLLSKRVFDDTDKATKYEQQNHRCAICGAEFVLENMHGDHITPWSAGGRTVLDNLQMLCRDCNLRKSAQAL
ncbi:MAG: HNH endonuclease [Dysgonamonadaceae bacterium]|jgi:predicted restriction endonuclease|nr:HNH endonuclease [Dysgonamonadaceae bacterium]